MAEPFTWTAAAWALAAGTISWIGTKVLDSVFKSTSGPDPVKLQAESIRDLALVFQNILDNEQLQSAADKLKSLINNIAEYNSAPSTSFFRLQDATMDSLDLLSTLASLEYPGFTSYLVAASMRITILQELHSVSGDKGELLNILRQIRQSLDECEDTLSKARTKFLVLLNKLTTQPRELLPRQEVPVWVASFNGLQFSAESQLEAAAWLEEVTGTFRKKEMGPVEESYEKVRGAWFGVRVRTLERARAAGLDVPQAYARESNFQSVLLQTGTALHETDETFKFIITDWDRDGRPDMVAVSKKNTGTKSTEIHVLSGKSNFQTFIEHTGTALHETDDAYDFVVTDWNGDGRPDLVVIQRSNTATGSTEVQVLSSASNFQLSILEKTGTALPETDENFEFMVTDWNGDGRLDLVAIEKGKTGTNSTKVHILSGASNFQKFLLQTGTALYGTDGNSEFMLADWSGEGRPDLVAIRKSRPGTNGIELHIVSASSDFQNYILMTEASLQGTNENFAFAMAVWDGPRRPDLFAIQKRGADSNATTIQVLKG